MLTRLNQLAVRQAILLVLALALALAFGACSQGGTTLPTPPAAKAPLTSAPATTAPAATTAPTKPAAATTAVATTPSGVKPGGGDPEKGKAAIAKYGCGGCHVIPGVAGANGTVGPSLAAFGNLTQIVNTVPNTTENLVKWIMDPPSVKPTTTMPKLGVTEPDAKDIAAYLLTLK